MITSILIATRIMRFSLIGVGLLACGLCFIAYAAPVAHAAGRVFYDGFEDGTTNAWSAGGTVGYYAKCDVVTSALDGGSGPQAGTRMARCNWDGTQGDFGHRHQGLSKTIPEASEYLYRFWTRADADVDAKDGSKLGRFQAEGCSFIDYLFVQGSNPGNFYDFEAECNSVTSLSGYDTTGGWPKTTWRKWAIYIKDDNSTGIVRVWINDVLDKEAVNVDTSSSSYSWGVFYAMSNWSLNPGWDHDANNHMYWDEFEVYTSLGSGGTGSMSAGTMTQSGGGDTNPPTAPGTPACNASSSTAISCTWTTSTDDVAVTGYKIERCQHRGCSSWSQIDTTPTNSYADTVSSPTVWQYRVRAYDAATNDSSYSSAGVVAAPTAPTPFGYGIAMNNEIRTMSTQDRALTYDDIEVLGATWVRLDMTHSSVESTQGVFVWTIYDTIINELVARGLNIMPILAYSPAWNRDPAATGSTAKPTSSAAFANFASLAVARYKDRVHKWEIWNEPNLNNFWLPNGANVVEYVDLLCTTYDAIKLEDNTATVITAGIAPNGDFASGANSGVNYVAGIYTNGGRHCFDAIGWHPYQFPQQPDGTQSWNGFGQMFQGAITGNIRGKMTSEGDSYKQIWPTEWGAPTDGWINANAVTEEFEAQWYVTWNYQTLAATSWSGPGMYYTSRDLCTDSGNRECWFGLAKRDWTRKAGFAAYQALTGSDTTPPSPPSGLAVQ